jgi:hypothetical protein
LGNEITFQPILDRPQSLSRKLLIQIGKTHSIAPDSRENLGDLRTHYPDADHDHILQFLRCQSFYSFFPTRVFNNR